ISPCRYAQMHLVTGFDILAGPYEWKLTRLPIIRMAGRTVTVGDKRVRYGLVRFMKDNVRLKNFWRSIAAEQLGYAPKAQWLATESAVEGKEEAFRKAHLTRDPLLTVNDEAIIGQNIQRIEPPPMQAALLNEAALNTQDMKDITGIHDASLGIKSNETSGRAIMARQREGDVASLTYYDNGNASLLEGGDVVVQLIGQIYDNVRIVRTIGEDESVKLTKINDPHDPNSPNIAVGDYDVALTTGPNYTTRRVEAADAMMQAVQVFPQLMQIAGDLIVKAQEWPGAEELSERLAKAVPPQYLSDQEKQDLGMPPGPSQQELMQRLAQMQATLQEGGQELQKTKIENLTLKSKNQVENRRLDLDTYKAETDRLAAYAQILHTGTDLTLQALEQDSNNAFNMTELAAQRTDAQQQPQQQDPQAQNPGAPTPQDTADRDLLNLMKIKALAQRLSANPASTPQID
ncbi:MAG TPA: portal protein, partial [Candidatus Paceibacterota bacterium]